MSRDCTIEQFKDAWQEDHLGDEAASYLDESDSDRFKAFCQYRGSVMAARTWSQLEDRCWHADRYSRYSRHKWHNAAINKCLPWQL